MCAWVTTNLALPPEWPKLWKQNSGLGIVNVWGSACKYSTRQDVPETLFQCALEFFYAYLIPGFRIFAFGSTWLNFYFFHFHHIINLSEQEVLLDAVRRGVVRAAPRVGPRWILRYMMDPSMDLDSAVAEVLRENQESQGQQDSGQQESVAVELEGLHGPEKKESESEEQQQIQPVCVEVCILGLP